MCIDTSVLWNRLNPKVPSEYLHLWRMIVEYNSAEVHHERCIGRGRLVPMILVTILMLAWATLPSEVNLVQADNLSLGNASVVDSRGSPVTFSPPQAGTETMAVPSSTTSEPWLVDSQTSTVEVANVVSPQPMFNLYPLPKDVVFMQRKRNKLEIYAEVLRRLLADPLGITEIALFCRLNFSSAKEIVDSLVGMGLLETVELEGNIGYATTRKGSLTLRDIGRVSNLFN
jgi:predicted transcriptional regulator